MKFGEALNAQLTSEWRSQYLKYDEAKQRLQSFKENTPLSDDANPHDLEVIVESFESSFFEFMEKELQKINVFFLEKLNEAKRRFAKLSSDLEDYLRFQQQKESKKRGEPVSGFLSDTKELKSLSIHDFRLAYSEFYLNLILLQNFQQLNLTAFRKILKKHDKVLATTQGSKWRFDVVLVSDFATSKAVDELIAEIERETTQKIEHGDHKKAMKRLRVPPLGQPHHSSWTVFRIGLWCGLLALFFVVIAALIPWSDCEPESRGCWHHYTDPFNFTDPLADDRPRFWEITIRLYRGIFLFALMILLLGMNIHGWRASGVNHVLIFELDPRDHLSAFHLIEAGIALLVFCSASLTVWLLQFYVSFVFDINVNAIRYTSFAFILLLVVFLINPLPIFMHTSRIWLLKVLVKILTAPFHTVRFADFWLADQFTSLVPVFQDFVFIICTCAVVFDPTQVNIVCDGRLFVLKNVIGCMPAWFRFAQCLRRYRDSGKKHPHLTNAGKYSTTFLVILFRSFHVAWEEREIDEGITIMPEINSTTSPVTTYPSISTSPSSREQYSIENPFLYCWIVAGTISTIYTYTWDVKMDWGLFDPNCGENRFLREHIVFRYKWYYYLAIVLDLILRLSWTLIVADIQISDQTYITDIFITSLTFVEMFRRFVWNFFRLENEHVNNAGEFRAVRDISIKPILNEDIRAVERMMAEEDGANLVRHERRTSCPTIEVGGKNKFDLGSGFQNAFSMTSSAAAPLFRRFTNFYRNRDRTQATSQSLTERLDGPGSTDDDHHLVSINPEAASQNDDQGIVVSLEVPTSRKHSVRRGVFLHPHFERQESAQVYESFRKPMPPSIHTLVDRDSDED